MQNARHQTEGRVVVGDAAACPDLVYATGFSAPDAAVFVDAGAIRILVISTLEEGRARRIAGARGIRVHSPADLGLRGAARRRLGRWAVAALREAGCKRARVGGGFPLETARELERAGIRVRIAAGPLYPERAVKTAEEQAHIRETQRAAVLAMRAAIAGIARARIHAGGVLYDAQGVLTSERVRRSIAGVLMEQGCEGRDTIVAGGSQAADPHEKGHGPLRAGEAIVIDIFPRHLDTGYWGDLTRTVVKGPASHDLKRRYRAVRAAQQAALAALRPRVGVATVHAAAADILARRGYRTFRGEHGPEGFIHRAGHGVGLAIHEAPSLGPGPGRLRRGHVVTVEPGLYAPGRSGIRIEDTVVVTADGWRYLAPCEKRFEV
jgi:Xaa-Pro aminopeptidase